MSPQQATEQAANILVVDDTPANLRVLSRLLGDRGYKVRPVPNGTLALEAVKSAPPDLILLDIRMPDMDGYEVCSRLKSEETTREIPVIFISAMHELEDKVRGFEAGGVDFITKPFQEGEVLIRLKTHLTIRYQQRRLEEQYEELRKLQIMRETLTQMIVHDLNNPLHGILGFAQLLSAELRDGPGERATVYADSIVGSTRTMVDMIRALLDVGKMESDEMVLDIADVQVLDVVDEVKSGMDPLLEQKNVTLKTEIPQELPSVRADREILRRIIVNLVGNSIKFSPEGGEISILAAETDVAVRVCVADEGPGIPPEYRDRIFEKYGQVESRDSGKKYSTGLGLTFCKMAVEAHEGVIGVECPGTGGSSFWFELPKAR